MPREEVALALYEILYCPDPNDVHARYPSASNGAERRTSMSAQEERDPRVDYSDDIRPSVTGTGDECSRCFHKAPLHERGCVMLKHPQPRNERQMQIAKWVKDAFGEEQAKSLPHRGIRMVEEAIELAQAAGTDKAMIHKLVDFVYDRPVGEIGNELGGLGVTMLALANTAGLDADEAEAKEVRHIFSKPLEYYTRRNAAKNAAGFDGTPKVCISIETKYVMPGWGCCQCNTYNGDNRPVCKNCQHPRCGGAS